MTRGGCILRLCVAGAMMLGSGAIPLTARAARNPYDNVTERNLFGLKPPPAPPSPDDVKAPPPDIKLTGITTILGNKRALMKAQTPAKPPQPAKEESYILTEGQSEGDIEVISIDEKAGVVKVNNHGKIQTLDFANNGVKSPGGPGPGALAGGVPPPPGPGGFRQIPPRMPRSPSDPPPGSPPASPPGTTPSPSNPNPSVNPQSSTSGGGSGLANNGAVPQQNNFPPPPQNTPRLEDSPQFTHGLSGEQQMLLIEAQRARLLDQGSIEEANMYPPTELTP